jgi:raffinose/stachyose/melibiose transport system substrate-binding protein
LQTLVDKMSRAPRRIRIGALIGSAAIIAAGCGSSSSTSATGGGTQTLKIISWVNPPANQAFQKIDAEFEKKYPNIKVQFQTAANTAGPYETLLQTTVDSGSADIVTTDGPIQPLPVDPTRANMETDQFWGTHNVFLPLNGQPWLNSLTPAARQSMTYNGKVYGLLSGDYQWVVFYNKTDFAKYHLSVPHTYDQFITVLKTLAAKHVTPLWLGLGGGASGYAQQFLTEPLMADLWAPKVAGANLATALEKGTTSWNDPAFVQGMTEEAAIAKYLEPNYTGESWQGMPGDFAANKAPMLLDGSWDLASIQKANPKIQVGSFALPGSNTASANQPLVADDLTLEVLKNTKHKAAALKWMAFFASKPIYEQYVNITGISPSEASGTYSSFSSSVLGPLFGKGANTGDVFPPLSSTQGYYDTDANFPTLQLSVMGGSKSPASAASTYASDWKKS